MSHKISAVYRARWVLPVTAPPIRDGAVLVGDDGRIAAVGPAQSIDAAPGTQIHDLGEAILLPGLINAHGHAELSVFRGALEELDFPDWILRLVGTKRAVLSSADLQAAARWSAIEAIRAGITTFAATEASDAAVHALDEAGLRGVIYQEVFGPDPAQAEEAMEGLRTKARRLRSLSSDRVRIGISPHAPFTVSDRLYRAATEFARAEGLPMAVHIAESAAERALITRGDGAFAPGLRARGIDTPRRGRSSIELLDRLGVLAARPLLIHCVDLDGDDIERIADSESSVAHCPVANVKLGHGTAPIVELREAGITVALGTDSVGSNNRLDLLEEARIAALMQRGRLRRVDALPTETLLRMVTVEGARALGLQGEVGELRPGMQADLCAVSIEAPHTQPVHDPLATLFHAARGSDVILTVVAGRVLFAGESVLTLNEQEVRQAIEQCAERMRAHQ